MNARQFYFKKLLVCRQSEMYPNGKHKTNGKNKQHLSFHLWNLCHHQFHLGDWNDPQVSLLQRSADKSWQRDYPCFAHVKRMKTTMLTWAWEQAHIDWTFSWYPFVALSPDSACSFLLWTTWHGALLWLELVHGWPLEAKTDPLSRRNKTTPIEPVSLLRAAAPLHCESSVVSQLLACGILLSGFWAYSRQTWMAWSPTGAGILVLRRAFNEKISKLGGLDLRNSGWEEGPYLAEENRDIPNTGKLIWTEPVLLLLRCRQCQPWPLQTCPELSGRTGAEKQQSWAKTSQPHRGCRSRTTWGERKKNKRRKKKRKREEKRKGKEKGKEKEREREIPSESY